MKILRLTTLLDFGGQEKQYVSFTEIPKLLQYDYVFAAIGYGGNSERILREKGYEVHILDRRVSIRNILNIWAVYRLIKKIKPDVVHTAATEANFHGIIAAKLAGVKYIIGEEIGIPSHSNLAQKLFSWIYNLANKVVCVSQSVKDYLVKIGEIKESKGVVIYNPVSVPMRYPQKKGNYFHIVFVGRLERIKNADTLIKSIGRLKSLEVRLTIVGDGRERESLEKLAGEINVRENITFTGFSDNPSEYLSDADLFVLPSYSEGFGIAAVEAMFLKIPVLCTNIGGISEFVRDGENGWLFDPYNVEQLTGKIRMIASMNTEQRMDIGKNGFITVSDKFTIAKYINNLEQLYSEGDV
ncbi:glycosyltransferase [Niabella sp.]|uniref:glycosyltransferase n=1 Tax=Niabella sp. TaxID=1962976 RepID=UPI002637CA19|nr:glycosyltransferase [Niabella sp.]